MRKVEVEVSGACNEPTEGFVCCGSGDGGVRLQGVAWWRSSGDGGVLASGFYLLERYSPPGKHLR